MTIDKAIKQLQGMLPSKETLAIREAFNYEKAVQLGIEALERINQMRDLGSIEATEPLPSEEE